jgi:carbonic anhydrase
MRKRFLFHSLIGQNQEEFIIIGKALLTIALIASATIMMAAASEEKNSISPGLALEKLLEGNLRYAEGNASHPNQSLERRAELISGQHPFAVILGCSDSRIPPEIVFDQGMGDIFVIRTAGEVLDNASIASIEYAVEHLSVPLVVVLGHDSCGAVTAAVKGGAAEGHLGCLMNFINPAVEQAREAGEESNLLNSSIDNNVINIVKELQACQPILSEKVDAGELMVVGAHYHLDSGEVEILE